VSDSGSSIEGAAKTSDPTLSVGYCQLLDDGQWVTNDSASSTTPCVPDPSYATGDEQADASVAVPRCYTCKLSDWTRAETQAAVRAGHASATSTVAATGATGWSSDDHKGFMSECTAYLNGSLCECLANHLAWRIPPDQAQGLSGEDPRVQEAVRECRT
jgi:hypothetical protein